MTMLIENPRLEEELKEQRKARGADHHDEVWEGVYFMAPLADNDHQELATTLAVVLHEAIAAAGLGKVLAGANLAGAAEDWRYDYRVPDVVVFLAAGRAENQEACWRGAADFVVEITSPGDRTHEKIPFYSRLGVRELLIVNRQSWTLELYRNQGTGLLMAGQSETQRSDLLHSGVVPLEFRLLPGQPRPRIEAIHVETRRQWLV
jgi:Uma2 family endonuclease